MKPTAEQVIEEFRALSPDEKRRVRASILPSGDILIGKASAYQAMSPKTLKLSSQKAANKIGKKILWKKLLIRFIPNEYISNYEEIWLLESILGSDTVNNNLSKHRVLDADFVEQLFRQATYSFYLNQRETYLFSDYGDVSDDEGGPLKQVTAFDALQRYGLKLMEEAKEKQYVRL